MKAFRETQSLYFGRDVHNLRNMTEVNVAYRESNIERLTQGLYYRITRDLSSDADLRFRHLKRKLRWNPV